MTRLSVYLSLALVFVIPFENIVSVAGVGTLARSLGLVVGAVWVVKMVAGGRFRRPQPFHLAVLLFCLWNAASLFWTLDFDASLEHVQTYVQLGVLSFMLWDLYDTPPALRAALQAYVLGAYVAVASTGYNYFVGLDAAYQRYAGAGFNADDLGVILVLGIPLAWHLAVTGGALSLRLVNFCYLPAALFGVMLSGTRTALIAALPVAAFVLASLRHLNMAARLGVGLAAGLSVAVLLPLIPEASLARFATLGEELSGGDLNGRLQIWREGLTALLAQPLTGVGSDAFRAAVASGKVAHNVFISVAVETGVIGLVIFCSVLVLVLRSALAQPRPYAGLWLSVLAAWLLAACALTIEPRKQTWLVFSLAVCSAGLYAGRETRRPVGDI